MEYQSIGRIQRPKGTNIKQALKVVLVLAVCGWLLYQIKHSRNSHKENYRSQTKLDGEYGAISLGRKGSRLEEVDSVEGAKDSSNDREHESNGAKEDKAEEEIGYINEKFRTREGKEVEHEPESQPKVSSKNKYKDLFKKVDIELRRSESGLKINDSISNNKVKEIQLNDVHVRKKNARSDFSKKENDREKKTGSQENVVESATNVGMTEEIYEIQSFQDENGVPPDGNETEIVFGHEENISNASKGNWLRKNIYEVTSAEDDNNVEVNSEASKNDAIAGEEINTGIIITHVDTSGILSLRNSEIGEGDSLVL